MTKNNIISMSGFSFLRPSGGKILVFESNGFLLRGSVACVKNGSVYVEESVVSRATEPANAINVGTS